MDIPFNIYMLTPSVLVQPIYSGWNLTSANNIGTWGEVIQVNASTTIVDVGNFVFYNPADIPMIYSSDTNQFYNVVDEDLIFFIEA